MALAMDYCFTSTRTNEILLTVAKLHAENISSAPVRECLLHYVNSNDVPGLCNYSVDYAALSVNDAIELRQVLAFFQKREDVDLGIDKEKAAYDTFVATEALCRETNLKIRRLSTSPELLPADVHAIFHSASRKISRVLGAIPKFEDLEFHFGPGATTSINKKNASLKRKLSEGCQCSEGLVGLLPEILEEVPAWCELLNTADTDRETYSVPVTIVEARLSFVPKNAKTYRSIVVEPSLNGFVQLGLGDYIARRLYSHTGIDIRDQSANQRAAREGSLLGNLATLDLSNASDTICKELVYHLLPLDWALLLDRCRSDSVEYRGSSVKLQMFSSSGNGFTFPLETLIFWALASASSEDDPRVLAYGDDLVVPTEYAERCIATLAHAGFIVNVKKSYVSGPFRESCGKDYLLGINIRPLYIKNTMSYFDLFRLHNWYVRSMRPEISSLILSYIPVDLRLWGPDGYGDGHLLGDHPVSRHRYSDGWGGYTFDTYTRKGRADKKARPGDYVLPAYTVYQRGDSQFFESRFRGAKEYYCLGFTPHTAGSPRVSLPGDNGYKRIKIYTLG